MSTEFLHPIKYVARHTGLKPYLIRTWEERYAVVRPKRSSTNRRLYSDDDIQRLRLLKLAVDSGHNISYVASLGDDDLLLIVERARNFKNSVDQAEVVKSISGLDRQKHEFLHTVELALSHIIQLNSSLLEKVLSDAAVEMSRQTFLQFVIMPLFEKIGELWREGNLKIINENMASIVVRSMLWDMLRAVRVSDTSPKIVVATPVGHWHEFGALASALAASESGWQAFYFGPNLPSEEIAFAVKKLDARVLALSLCHRLSDNNLLIELQKIRRLVGHRVPLFIGGPGVVAVKKTISSINAVIINDLRAFRDRLENLSN
jgi:DNA-binding transcriptional MerR regulator